MIPASGTAARTIHVSSLDNVRFTLGHFLPIYLQGLFTRRRLWVSLVSALHPDPLSVRFVSRLRHKYGTGYLQLRVGRTPMLLVLERHGIRHVLERSPDMFGEPQAKRRGMSRFQPEALTISRGAAWKHRRLFNEQVLQSDRQVHSSSASYLRIVRSECERMLERAVGDLLWKDFERLFERITLSVLLGRAAADDVYLTRTLTQLMCNANRSRLLPPRRMKLVHFQQALRSYLEFPEKDSLAARCRETPSTSVTQVASQLTHWMFAMNETLAINVVRALTLITADRECQSQLRRELAGTDVEKPEEIVGRALLRGCLQEAMRLWPTTPMLLRETVRPVELGGSMLPRGTNVLIFNSFIHRDSATVRDADRFEPQRWIDAPEEDGFLHFSQGSQICAGRELAILLGTAVLASLLRRHDFTLQRPVLRANQSVPHAMNFFRARFACHEAT